MNLRFKESPFSNSCKLKNSFTEKNTRLLILWMKEFFKILLVSDIHYACEAERQRRDFEDRGVPNPLLRPIARMYRRFVWLRDPLNHYDKFYKFLEKSPNSDLCVALGDFTCDTAFVGVSDDVTFASAKECVDKLRSKFGKNFKAVIGDHELGKLSLFGGVGGLRLESYYRVLNGLKIEPYWQYFIGNYILIGITSSVVAMPIFISETLQNESEKWRDLHEEHLKVICEYFKQVESDRKIILFCHDPSALSILGEIPLIREKFEHIEMTVIGHLHSNAVFKASKYFAGIPEIKILGHTPRRLSKAMQKARVWKNFKVSLCPSLAGIQLLKDGGFCELTLDLNGKMPPQFNFHRLPWD